MNAAELILDTSAARCVNSTVDASLKASCCCSLCVCVKLMISMNRKNNRNPGGYYYYFLSETTAAAALRETRRRSAEQAHSNGSVTTGSEHELLPVRRHIKDTFKGSESQTDVRHTDTGLFQINLKVDDLFCSQHRLIQSKVHFL